MTNLLFIRRSLRLRHAAVAELRRARALAPGSTRDEAHRRARGLMDLARTEAWLEGQSPLASQGFRRGRSNERRSVGA
jgi:hypothetical protein